MAGQLVAVLGGGTAGVVAASELRKHLPEEHRVLLVDRRPRHLYEPSLLWVMTGQRKVEGISRPLQSLRRRGIDVLQGEVVGIDAEKHTVDVEGETLSPDHLLVALGAEYAPEAIPGLMTSGHTFYTPEGAEALNTQLNDFDGGRILVLTAAPAYKCPAAPYEAALLIEALLRGRGLQGRFDIELHAAEPAPMGVAGPAVSAGVRALLDARNIAYHPEHQIDHVIAEKRQAVFTDGQAVDFDLLVYVPPHRAPQAVRESGLTDESGWIPVGRHSLQTKEPGIHAVGDVTVIPLKMGKPLPKAGVFAHGAALVAARNIARSVTGRGHTESFDGNGQCFIEAGDGRAGFGRGDFYAEPNPHVRLYNTARHWHWAKLLLERYWLRKWFTSRP
jgi:sulfide:quinone oxidoreductase